MTFSILLFKYSLGQKFIFILPSYFSVIFCFCCYRDVNILFKFRFAGGAAPPFFGFRKNGKGSHWEAVKPIILQNGGFKASERVLL